MRGKFARLYTVFPIHRIQVLFCREPAAPALCRQENFTTPRAVVSLRFFNCFRLLLEKAEDPNELKIYVETLAFKPLGCEDIDSWGWAGYVG